jgi:hypothetical protein
MLGLIKPFVSFRLFLQILEKNFTKKWKEKETNKQSCSLNIEKYTNQERK